LQLQLDKLRPHGFEMRPKFAQVGDDTIIGSSSWLDEHGDRQERYQVLTIRDGKIADMQVCGSYRQAKRFAARALR
jgi:hypothetical protein